MACGQAVQNRAMPSMNARTAIAPGRQPVTVASAAPADQIILAGREVRCCCYLLDLAVTLSPVVTFVAIAALLDSAGVLYIVMPVAVAAVWLWLQLWQGLTGLSPGKAVLGMRAVRGPDHNPPGMAASTARSLIFGLTAGLAALPVLTSTTPRGRHDQVTGIDLIDVTLGRNPFGARQQSALRRTIDRSLTRVQSPVPLAGAGAAPAQGAP
jgi:RDD family